MKLYGPLFAILLLLQCPSRSSAQEMKAANPAAVPPNLLLLVHQEIQPGKGSERQRLDFSRSCDRLDTPNLWIDLQPLTGPREALFFDPFDSFEHLEQAHTDWKQFYAAHPDFALAQKEIDSLVSSERTIIAMRRDDLGYLADTIDLSEARFMRVVEIRIFPGHESDFRESIRLLSEAYSKVKADSPWVVYEVNQGTPSPAFLVFLPMSELKQNDDLWSLKETIAGAEEGEGRADRLKQIVRETFASTESNLYVINPEMSHVSKEFAAGSLDFWRHGNDPEPKTDAKPAANPPKKKPSARK
jgi:hypothetical protein